MKPETLEALKACIVKWGKNSRVQKIENAKLDTQDCPLCLLYHESFSSHNCVGCPIYEAGHYQCYGTPYQDALNSRSLSGKSGDKMKAFRDDSKREEAFLKSLLPEGEA